MKRQVLPLRAIADAEATPQDQAGSAKLNVGTITHAQTQAEIEIEIGGRPCKAKRAFSCLLEPLAGDRVLAAETAEGLHILAILDRPAPGHATLALPSAGALTLRSTSFNLVSDSVTLFGRLLTLMAETLHLSARDHQISAETIASTSRDRVSIVEQADVLRAGSLTQTIEAVAVTTAPIAVIATEEDLRLDGKRVTVG